MVKEEFGSRKIAEVKTSDAKLFLIKLQQDGRGSSTIKTVRGVLRPAFQMAMDDDIIVKNPFAFQLAGVVVNTEHTREAITKEQMRKFLKFVHDDNVYCKYYEVFYILFHTGLRISEFCGLTIKDLDMKNRIINIDHQLQRLNNMEYLRWRCIGNTDSSMRSTDTIVFSKSRCQRLRLTFVDIPTVAIRRKQE